MRQASKFYIALPIALALATIPAVAGMARSVVYAQQAGALEVLPVQGNVYLIGGAGANITVQVYDTGVVLVDTGDAASSDKVLAAVRQISDKPIRYIINTQYHADHNGGNEAIAKAARNPPVLAHEGVLNRMSAPVGSVSPRRTAEWPTDTFFTDLKDLSNGEAIQIIHQAAQNDGDSFVVFRRSDVISAGDIYMTTTYPPIDLEAGGHINGIIEGLNKILDIAVPVDKQENGTLIIPGHGRISDEADVVEYRDMLTIIRDRVQDAIKSGMTLAQVKSGKLTQDFDKRYGASSGPASTEMFLDAVYKNLSKDVAPKNLSKEVAPKKK